MNFPAALSSPDQRRIEIAKRWPALTNDDIAIAHDDREALIIRVVERYGISKEWAEHQVVDWELLFDKGR